MRTYLILSLMTGLFLGSVSSFAATELAKINQTVITVESFNKQFEENKKFFPLKAPNKKAVLDDLIKREIGIQEAKRQGLDKTPEFQEKMNTVLFNSLIEKNLSKEVDGINISDRQAKSYYEKSPILRTSQIFVALAPNANEQQKKEALEKVKKIQNELNEKGKTFAEVAQNYSEGPTAALGGDMDYQSRATLDPTYYEAALALDQPGSVSDLVQSSFGYHIIKLTGKKSWEEINQASIKRIVFEEEKAKVFEKYMNKLRSQAKISVQTDLLTD